ncbi:MAG: sodium-extruding oxaloacetate decarboxylase subunit alpha [Planctomycetes bacterium]|nr:sodium-extruding oxaloacetate decarboxylase subunit alpha [Planctomycetota bacterium]
MKVKITETVLRDGHQSLIATRMSTGEMLPILEKLDQVGYFSLEMWGGATFDVCLRFLNEDPWERLRQIKKVVKNTKLQMLLRGQNLVGYRHYPDDIVNRFVEKAKENGIDIFRIFDAVNDIRNMTAAIKAAKRVGGIVEGAISYTISPVHTIEKFIKFAMELKDQGVDIICIKDMAGLISPAAAFDLVNHLKKEVKLPVHLHSHCSSGMAPIAYLTACEAGVDILDTTVSPFAWGTSQPPTETIVGALKDTPYDTGLDMEKILEVTEYFQKIKQGYKHILDPIAERVDPKIMLHQIPGGMLSNLISQLKQQNATNRYDEVLKETAEVRKDLGYPPLVTPTSQIVGTQAVVNVLTGVRYKIIPKEIKDYFRGLYGQPPGPVNEEIKMKAIGDAEPIKGRAADGLAPELDAARQAVKAYNGTEEDALSYALFPQVAIDFFKKRLQGIGPTPASEFMPPSATGEEKIKEASDVKMKQGKEPRDYIINLGNKRFDVTVSRGGENSVYVDFGGKRYEVNLDSSVAAQAVQGAKGQAEIPAAKPKITEPKPEVKKVEEKTVRITPGAGQDVNVPMPGKIVDIRVKVGDSVKRGDILFILEAMKMQNEIDSPVDGVVSEVNITIGANADTSAPVMKINPA